MVQPTSVAEPHTVTFTFGDLPAMHPPFIISNATKLMPALQDSNAEPLAFPGKNCTNVVVACNPRSWNLTVIDAYDEVMYLPPNGDYAIAGTPQYVNSGFLWPEDQVPRGLPPTETFSVTFESEGTYDYICILHPWMAGPDERHPIMDQTLFFFF